MSVFDCCVLWLVPFFLLVFLFRRNFKSHPLIVNSNPWYGWSANQTATNDPENNVNLSTEEFVRREFTKLQETDGNSHCIGVPPTFEKGNDPDRILGEEAEETVFNALKGNQIEEGMKIWFFNGQRYMGKREKTSDTDIIREKDFSIFLEYKEKFYIKLIEVKCCNNKDKNHRKKANKQLEDHCQVLEVNHEIKKSEVEKIMRHTAWPRLNREYKCNRCSNCHYVYQQVPDDCPEALNAQKQSYEEPGWHLFSETFASQKVFDKWLEHSLTNEKAMEEESWNKILGIHIHHACGALYEEFSKKFILLGLDQVALRDVQKQVINQPKFVSGIAGTGKTVTVCAKIEQLFKNGEVNGENKILFICFNDALIEYVKKFLEGLACEKNMNLIEFRNYATSSYLTNFYKDKNMLHQLIYKKHFKFIFFDEAEDLGVEEISNMLKEVIKNSTVKKSEYIQEKKALGHFWILFDVFQSKENNHGLSLIGGKRSRLKWDGKRIEEGILTEGKKEGLIVELGTVFRMTRKIVEHINNKCLSTDLFNLKDTEIEGLEVDFDQITLSGDVDRANLPARISQTLIPFIRDVFERNIHPGHLAILLDTEDIKTVFPKGGLQAVITCINNTLNTMIKSNKNDKKLAPEVTSSIQESILFPEPHPSLLRCKCKSFMGPVDEVKGLTIKIVVYVSFFRSDGVTPLVVEQGFVSRTSPHYKAASRSCCELQIKEIVLDDDLLIKLKIPLIPSKAAQNAKHLETLNDLHTKKTPFKPLIKRY